jgi:hypothetical protein
MKLNIEITENNPLGIVELNFKKEYIISGIICCIGIIIRSFTEDNNTGNINLISGLAVHFINGIDNNHFTEKGITDFGNQVIKNLKIFIKDNKKNKIQLDLITNRSTPNSIIREIKNIFIKNKKITNLEIKHTKNTGRIEFNPAIWNF